MNQEIIEQLKSNLSEWQELSDELQNALKVTGVVNIQLLTSDGSWIGSWIGKPSPLFNDGKIYRLHPDYQPEPEIVECQIKNYNEQGEWCWLDVNRNWWVSVDAACRYVDFIGFRVGDTLFGGLYQLKSDLDYKTTIIPVSELHLYNVLSMADGHVLFRKQQ